MDSSSTPTSTLPPCTAGPAIKLNRMQLLPRPQLHTLRDGRRVRTLRALGDEVWGRRGRRWLMALQLTDMVCVLSA